MINRIDIKPLSLNHAYRGRRFKSKELIAYKKFLSLTLPKLEIPKGKLRIWIRFGFSSKGSDIDNCVKCFLDALSETYGFNDNRVYGLNVYKVDVKKGEEFIEFGINDLYFNAGF